MNNPAQSTTSVTQLPSPSPWRHRSFVIAFVLGMTMTALLPVVQAVTPAPDGGYPNANTAEGEDALFSLTSGTDDTATGFHALFSDTTGRFNTASGSSALQSNTIGEFNTASGYHALFNNIDGNFNTGTGTYTLELNTTGYQNTASGYRALANNATGNNNTASGFVALHYNTGGSNNTATGYNALYSNATGNSNTADGEYALYSSTGSNNIALGASAGMKLTTGSDNIDIGNPGLAGDSKTIRIGTKQIHRVTFIAGISGATVAGGVSVMIDPSGHLGTVTSSARFKSQIQPMDKASEAILSLEPVTFRYKQELDPNGIPQFGLVAEQVDKVNPDLVARDDEGKPYTVRYEAVNAMLLNEFLKAHRQLEEQQTTIVQVKSTAAKQGATIARLEAVVERQQQEIGTLTSQIHKVSDQLEASRITPQLVANDR